MGEVKAGRPDRADAELRRVQTPKSGLAAGRRYAAGSGNARCLRSPGESVEYQPEQGDRPRRERDKMGHKGTVRLAQTLGMRSKTALEEAMLLISEQLGFRYFMFCGRFSQARGATHEVWFDNFPIHWHRYCADRGRDLLPGPLGRLALQEVTPVPWREIATRHGKAFAKAGEFGLVTGVSCSVYGPGGQWSLTSFALTRGGAAAERRIIAALPDCQLVASAIHYAAAL